MYGVLYIPGGAGFLPSAVSPDEMTQVPMIQRLVLRASMSSLQDSDIARCKEVLFGKCVISRTIDINPSCLCCFESPSFPSKYEYLYIVTESFDNACSSAKLSGYTLTWILAPQGFGSVEVEEFWKLFRRCDRDADGHISKSDLVHLIEVVCPGRHYGCSVGVLCG